jgi:hypothetical protein
MFNGLSNGYRCKTTCACGGVESANAGTRVNEKVPPLFAEFSRLPVRIQTASGPALMPH